MIIYGSSTYRDYYNYPILNQIIFDTTPFHDGYGMLTVDGIPKPAYRAFQLMHTLSNATIATQWSGSESAVTATVCVEDSSNTAQVSPEALLLHLVIQQLYNNTVIGVHVGLSSLDFQALSLHAYKL